MKIALWILAAAAAVLLLIFLLLIFLKVSLFARYDNRDGGFSCRLKVLWFSFPLYPQKKKKKPRVKSKKRKKSKKRQPARATIRSDLSDVAKAARIGKSAASGKARAKQSDTPLDKIKAAASALRILTIKLKALVPPLWEALTFTIESLHVTVGCDDAADTAIGYGLICAALEGLCAVENETDRLTVGEDTVVQTDYASAAFHFDLSLRVDIRVIKALYALYSAQIAYYKDKFKLK